MKMSGGGSACSRLCRLIDDSLRPYAELDAVSVNKEEEKKILLALSQVFRQVQLWTQEFDSDSDNDSMLILDCECGCSSGSSPHFKATHCLTKIVADLVVLLTVQSKYVQHLASNVLVVVSEFVAASGSNWGAFIHSLCACLNLAITIKLTFDSAPWPIGADDFTCGSSSIVLSLKQKLKDANWCAAAGILRVLRTILKHFNPEDDVQLFTSYFDSVNSCLSNVPWDLLTQICVIPIADAQKSSAADAVFQRSVFLGNFIQFLCSLVEQSGTVEAIDDSAKKCPDLSITISFVPKLLNWCLGNQGDCVDKCISLYFRHKLLVLIIRLSFQTPLYYSLLVSWLTLMHDYFGELLRRPITSLESVRDDCLEGSPFVLSVSDTEGKELCSLHLQRLAIFLFLRCSLSLISLMCGTDEKCPCATRNVCFPYEPNEKLDCCGRKKGLLELYNWLQGHVPVDTFVDYKTYLQKCVDFALSFLQLYIHELHYDHQVLLDYLISKDTGTSCAEYILRCLRTICDSWHIFVEFSVDGQFVNQSSCKKRKVMWDGSTVQAEKLLTLVKNDRTLLLLEKECNEESNCGFKDYQTIRQPYKDAKECLLSLRTSVESLHQKNLFPYNPKVLLKRLRRFEELCFKDEQSDF